LSVEKKKNSILVSEGLPNLFQRNPVSDMVCSWRWC